MSLAKNNLKKRNLTEKEREEAEIWADWKKIYNAGCNEDKKMNDRKKAEAKEKPKKHLTMN